MSFPALTRVSSTLFYPLAMPSPLLYPFLSSTLLCPNVVFSALSCPCNAHHPILGYAIHSALLFFSAVPIALCLLVLFPQLSLHC